jgi:hypothetical protein
LQITIATDKCVLDLKKAIAEKSEVEAERQRLIYSGASTLTGSMSVLTLTRTCIEGDTLQGRLARHNSSI